MIPVPRSIETLARAAGAACTLLAADVSNALIPPVPRGLITHQALPTELYATPLWQSPSVQARSS